MEVIFAEFGKRVNAGDGSVPKGRLEPALSSVRKYLPNAKVHVICDSDAADEIDSNYDSIEVLWRRGAIPFDRSHSRYGWRCNDYFKIIGMRDSNHEVAVALDADMKIISPRAADIEGLAKRFGFCLPINARWVAQKDARSEADGGLCPELLTHSPAYATGFMARGVGNLLIHYVADEMLNIPARLPLVITRAVGRSPSLPPPYLLPPQWCVTGGLEGIGDEIAIHVGHKCVADFYSKGNTK